MKFNKTLVAAACGLSMMAASVSAADVTVGGVLDEAIVYNYANKGVGGSVKLNSGENWGSRVFIAFTEQLTPGVDVIGRLEAGFDASDGRMAEHDRLFNRESTIGLRGKYGTLRFGRDVSLTEGIDPDTFLSQYTAQGTSFGLLSSGNVVGNGYGFVSNMVRYDSPKMAGFDVSLQYSNGLDNNGSRETGSAASSDRYYAVTANYQPASWFKLGLGWDYTRANGAKAAGVPDVKNPSRVFVGMHAFNETYGGYLMFCHSENVRELGHVELLPFMRSGDADSLIAGFDWKHGAHKVALSVGASDGDVSGAGKPKFETRTYQAGASWTYDFSKRTSVYGAAGWLRDRVKVEGHKMSQDNVTAMLGVTHKF